MYKKIFIISMVLLLAIALSGCDVLFGSGDEYSKYASSSSSDSTGAINSDLFNIQAPVNGENIYTASTHFKWYYNGDTSKVMYYRIFNEGSMIEITNEGGAFYDKELYNIVSIPGGHQNNWFIEAVDTNWNILARVENLYFNCDASGGTNDVPSSIWEYNSGPDFIHIEWNPVFSNQGYKIYGNQSGKIFFVGNTGFSMNSFYHGGLLPDMSIQYFVTSIDGAGKENPSGPYGFSTMPANFYPVTFPYTFVSQLIMDWERLYYKINVPSNQQVYIKLYDLSYNGEFEIFRANGEHVHYQNMHQDSSSEEIDLTLEAGDYFIVVKNYSGSSGTYSINIHF